MIDISRTFFIGIFCLPFVLVGCTPTSSTDGSTGKNASPSTAKSEAESDLRFLQLAFYDKRYGKEPERMPKDLEDAAGSIKVIDERIFARVKRGDYVIRWGVPLNSPVLAYEKDATARGGWVMRGGGAVEKMSAEQLNKLLSQKG